MTYRIDLTPEKQREFELAAAQAGMAVEAYILAAAEAQLHGEKLIVAPTPIKETRDSTHRARVQALRGKYPKLAGAADDIIKDRREEALSEMQKDSM